MQYSVSVEILSQMNSTLSPWWKVLVVDQLLVRKKTPSPFSVGFSKCLCGDIAYIRKSDLPMTFIRLDYLIRQDFVSLTFCICSHQPKHENSGVICLLPQGRQMMSVESKWSFRLDMIWHLNSKPVTTVWLGTHRDKTTHTTLCLWVLFHPRSIPLSYGVTSVKQ